MKNLFLVFVFALFALNVQATEPTEKISIESFSEFNEGLYADLHEVNFDDDFCVGDGGGSFSRGWVCSGGHWSGAGDDVYFGTGSQRLSGIWVVEIKGTNGHIHQRSFSSRCDAVHYLAFYPACPY